MRRRDRRALPAPQLSHIDDPPNFANPVPDAINPSVGNFTAQRQGRTGCIFDREKASLNVPPTHIAIADEVIE